MRKKPGKVATVNGTPILANELQDEASSQLKQMEMKIYEIKKSALNNIIENKLIEDAAKKQGITKEAYLKKNIEEKIKKPTENDLRKFYEARKSRIRQPFGKVKNQIANFLMDNDKKQAMYKLVSNLKKKANIDISLEPPRTKIELNNEHAIGNENAKVLLVEFSDYECPYSKKVRPTVNKLLKTYKDKIKYVFLDFPLAFHQNAPKAHEAARCAGDQGKYYEYSELLFKNQKKLKVDDLKQYAKKLNLDLNKFNKCLDEKKYANHVKKSMEIGSNAGVSGTPAFFINGIMLSGAQPVESFTEIIEEEIKK